MCKKILILILALFATLSCQRKPLYLRGDIAVRINAEVRADINTIWSPTWRDSLRYAWDEEKLGPIGYTLPKDGSVVLFNGGNIVKEEELAIGKRKTIDIEANRTYDLLIYSKEIFWIDTYYEGGRYFIEAPSEDSPTTTNEVSKKYETVAQPGEVFSTNKKEYFIPDDISLLEEAIIDGKYVYIFNIDEILRPVSNIYIIQFIVINDDGSEIIEAKDITNFSISGISSKKNLFNNEPVYTGNKQISVFDIKPAQTRKDSLLFASRITILDLLPNNQDTSWSSEIEYLYYSNVDIDTHNYGKVTGTKDITKQLKENPKGGIITVRILNSELKQGGETGSGFGIDLTEWQEHLYNVE